MSGQGKRKIGWMPKGICVAAALALAVIVLGLSNRADQKTSKELAVKQEEVLSRQKAEEEAMKIMILSSLPGDDETEFISAYDVQNNEAKGEILLDGAYFQEEANLVSAALNNTAKATLHELDISTQETDILVLQFLAYTEESAVTMDVSVGDITNTVYLRNTPTTFYIPMSGLTEVKDIVFEVTSDYAPTVIDELALVSYEDSYIVNELMTGVFEGDDRAIFCLDASSFVFSRAYQVLLKDDYLYVLGFGELIACKVEEVSAEDERGDLLSQENELLIEGSSGNVILTEVCRISGLSNARDMAFTRDESAIVVTARQSGAYIVEISSPEEMAVLSHYDTLEAATGLYIAGDYAFLSSRYFGIEIVDISDKTAPYLVNVIEYESEYQDCFVDGNYLYVGVNAQKRVDIYDIGDLCNPVLVAGIDTDGCAQGLFVQNGILYVATGRDSQNDDSFIWSYGLGTGNGLEIYDVSDPSNPVLLSVAKADGRMSMADNDIWDVTVSNGYAYVSDMYNGLLVYDVKNAENPVCVEEYRIEKEAGETSYDLTQTALSWDPSESDRGSVGHVAVTDGALWLISPDTGIIRIESEYAAETQETVQEISFSQGETLDTEIETTTFCADILKLDGCIWAADVSGDRIYVAAGDAGILVLDGQMNTVYSMDCDYSIKDVKVRENLLYAAQSEGGIGIYEIGEDDSLTLLGTFEVYANRYSISQIELTQDGKYIIAQSSQSSHLVVNVCDPAVPVLESAVSSTGLYFRNLVTGLVDDTYVGVAGKNEIYWYSCEDGELDSWVTEGNAYYYERGGMTAYEGGIVIAAAGSAYRYFDLEEPETFTRVSLSGLTGHFKLSYGDGILVACGTSTGEVIIADISDIDNPILLEFFTVDGNPDIAVITEDSILIPLRYGGLLKLSRS